MLYRRYRISITGYKAGGVTMLRITRSTRFCPAIEAEVVVDCQCVEINGKKVGPDVVLCCNSKHICKLVYEDENLTIKLNWQRCVLNQK